MFVFSLSCVGVYRMEMANILSFVNTIFILLIEVLAVEFWVQYLPV